MTRIGRRIGWGVGLLAFAAAVIFLALPRAPKADTDEEGQPTIQKKSRLTKTPEGDIILTLDTATQERAGLRTRALPATTLQPQVTAYGRLQEDPAESFEVRAPVAGTLRAAAGRPWPALGDTIPDGATLGIVQPRLTPADRLSISDQLIAARAQETAARSSVEAARAAYERAKVLNADNRNVSDRAVQEAAARLKGEQARLEAARDGAKLLEGALDASSNPDGGRALLAARGGEVAEVLAQAGEAVESGQPLVRLQRFDRLVARIYLRPDQAAAAAAPTVRITPVGVEGESLRGRRIGAAAAVDPESQMQPWLFRVSVPRSNLRPGAAVIAYLPVAGRPMSGVVVPESAVVRYAGKAWAYVQTGADKFARRELALDAPTGNGWFVTHGITPGEQVVVVGGQVLLSEELKSQIQVGEENPA